MGDENPPTPHQRAITRAKVLLECYEQVTPTRDGARASPYVGTMISLLIADLMHYAEDSNRSSEFLWRQAMKWHSDQCRRWCVPLPHVHPHDPLEWRPRDGE